MIHIMFHTKAKNLIGFEVDGHAGYDDYGKDIVCASVSVLTINTVNAIETFTTDQFECTASENGGQLYFRLVSNISEKSELLLNALNLGIAGIKEQYGNKYIEVKYKEV